jgi:P2 family phage contractile tail tube protein
MGVQINRITNANIYINNKSMLGRADEVQAPDLSVIETDQKSLGMIGKIALPAGFDKLEGKITWNAFYADTWAALGNPFKPVSLMLRSSLETYSSQGRISQVPLKTFITATLKKLPLGTFKQQDNAEFQSEYTATYIKQVCDNKDVIELDILANIFKINGVDQLSKYRKNIGG